MKKIIFLVAVTLLIPAANGEIILKPQYSLCEFVWATNFTDTSLTVGDTYIAAGSLGIEGICQKPEKITILKWNPSNKDDNGEDIIVLKSTGDAMINVYGLIPDSDYRVNGGAVNRTFGSNSIGVITFNITEGEYVITTGNVSAIFGMLPSPPPYPVSVKDFSLYICLFVLVVIVLIKIIRDKTKR